jgi:hypothetical protein
MAKDSEIYGVGNDDDFDTEEFDSFQKLQDKYGDKQKWFSNNDGEKMFNLYKEKTGRPFKVKTKKSEMGGEMAEMDTLGNHFTRKFKSNYSGALKDKFESHEADGINKIMDEIFSESKVEKIITKYFKIYEKEKKNS